MPRSGENQSSKDLFGILDGYSPSEPYEPPEKERELLSELFMRFEDARHYRLSYERQWELSRLYQKGQQLVIRNRTTGEVFRLPSDFSQRLIAVFNYIRPVSRSLLGKLTRTIPSWTTLPASSDQEEVHGAEIADSLLDYHRRENKIARLYIAMMRDVVTFGTGCLMPLWAPDAGRDIAVCPECEYRGDPQEAGDFCPACLGEAEGEFQEDQDFERGQFEADAFSQELEPGQEPAPAQFQEQEFDPKDLPALIIDSEGDTRLIKVDPRDIYPDPSAENIEDCQFVCRRTAMPVSQVRRMFPDKAKYVGADSGIFSEQYVTLLQNSANVRDNTRHLEDHVHLYEWHERPTQLHPDGRIIWATRSMILKIIDNPYWPLLKRFPFYLFFFERNAGEFWAESWIEQAWTIQREVNVLKTQKREHRELTMRQKLLVAEMSGISVDEIDTTAGQLIYYNPMFPRPQWLEQPPLPNYVQDEEDRLLSQIRTLASVTEHEQGESASEQSGRFAAILESQAAQQVGPILQDNAVEWAELGKGMLLIDQAFMDDDRLWTISGEDRQKPLTNAFRDLKLRPGFDVEVQEDDSLSKNHALRLQQVMEARERMPEIFIKDDGTPNRELMIKKSGLKMPALGRDTAEADRSTAAAIPYIIEAGGSYEPRIDDNADIFAEELLDWLKGPGRQVENAQTAQGVLQYWEFYTMRSRAALMQQQQFAGAGVPTEPGGPGGNGGAGPAAGNGQAMPGESQVLDDAGQRVQQADAEAESQARVQGAHEG